MSHRWNRRAGLASLVFCCAVMGVAYEWEAGVAAAVITLFAYARGQLSMEKAP